MKVAFAQHDEVITLHFDLEAIFWAEQHPIANFGRANRRTERDNLRPNETLGHLRRRRNQNATGCASLAIVAANFDEEPVAQHLDRELVGFGRHRPKGTVHHVQHASPAHGPITRSSVELVTDDGVQLEADLTLVTPSHGGAVLCHPHPLYGGDRQHPLLVTIADQLAAVGWSSLRADFRRDRADIVSEIPDVVAATSQLRSATQQSSICVVGYSFGALVALAAEPLLRPQRLVLIAPPLATHTTSTAANCPTTVIVGRHDQFCNPDQLATTPVGEASNVVVIDGADHFLHGHIAHVVAAVISALGAGERNEE